jgi:hypothetical protein
MRCVINCLAAVALLASAGCAALPNAGSQFDGSYSGSSVVTRGGTGYCGQNGPEKLVVSGGRFTYVYPMPWDGPLTIPTQVHADGSFNGAAQYVDSSYTLYGARYVWVTVLGRIDGGALNAQVESVTCARRLVLKNS